MEAENKIYPNFKTYKYYKANSQKDYRVQTKKDVKIKSLLGASIGVGSALALDAIVNNKNRIKNKSLSSTLKMLTMALFGNIGGVLGGSIKASRESKKKKRHEAVFQMMNTTLPMVMVGSVLEVCKKVKVLSSIPARIVASFLAMGIGAITATKITNATKGSDEKERQYSIKDTVANFDDIVATIKIGFEEVEKYIPVDKILPFIYIYSGSRAGEKE